MNSSPRWVGRFRVSFLCSAGSKFHHLLFSDMFLSAEGGWTDSDLLDLVMRGTDINMSTEKFLAFAKLCFMPVFKPALSSSARPETVNINLIADDFHKSRCLLCLSSNFQVAPRWLLGCCLPCYSCSCFPPQLAWLPWLVAGTGSSDAGSSGSLQMRPSKTQLGITPSTSRTAAPSEFPLSQTSHCA